MITLVYCSLITPVVLFYFIHRVRDKSREVFGQATDPQDVVRFSTFLAELFFRIRTEVITINGMHTAVYVCYLQQEDNPLWPFGSMLTQLIRKLLTLPYDHSVMSIVNMLKV